MGNIDISNLTFSYKNQKDNKPVLDNLNLQIKDGEFVCVLGHSGCGKSTLLNILAGLIVPDKGTITIDGRPLKGPGADRTIVFQNYSLFPWMTVRKNVFFGIQQAKKNLDKSKAYNIADSYLEKVDMAKAMDKYPHQLSGGMQQRVAIARSLAMDTEIILLDEPFGALDAKIKEELQQLLEQLWENSNNKKTIVFVTHNIEEAILLADRAVFMSNGQINKKTNISYPRPRNHDKVLKTDDYKCLKSKLLDWFYTDMGVG